MAGPGKAPRLANGGRKCPPLPPSAYTSRDLSLPAEDGEVRALVGARRPREEEEEHEQGFVIADGSETEPSVPKEVDMLEEAEEVQKVDEEVQGFVIADGSETEPSVPEEVDMLEEAEEVQKVDEEVQGFDIADGSESEPSVPEEVDTLEEAEEVQKVDEDVEEGQEAGAAAEENGQVADEAEEEGVMVMLDEVEEVEDDGTGVEDDVHEEEEQDTEGEEEEHEGLQLEDVDEDEQMKVAVERSMETYREERRQEAEAQKNLHQALQASMGSFQQEMELLEKDREAFKKGVMLSLACVGDGSAQKKEVAGGKIDQSGRKYGMGTASAKGKEVIEDDSSDESDEEIEDID